MKSIPDRLKDIRDAEEKLINDIIAIADSIEQLPENTKLNVISSNPLRVHHKKYRSWVILASGSPYV